MTNHNNPQRIFITGSRACTNYGSQIAQDLAADFANLGQPLLTTVGFGIDSAVVRGALVHSRYADRCDLTIVSATAPDSDHAYPRANTTLLGAARDKGARIVSPVTSEVPISRTLLREVADMCIELADVVVVVEAAIRSTARTTAERAAELGRPVYVVPGPVTSAQSAGVLRMAQAGARLIGSAQDVRDHLDSLAPAIETP